MDPDFNGFERLRHTTGVWRWVASLGLLVMLGGLAIFGFAILSIFTTFTASRGIPEVPTLMPLGFGIGIVGALGYSIGLAFGVPKDADLGQSIHIGHKFDRSTIIDSTVGGVQVIYQQRISFVNDLDDALHEVQLRQDQWPKAEAAMDAVRDAAENDSPEPELAARLDRLARILASGGALASSGSAAYRAIVDLVNTFSPAGRALFSWLGFS